MPQNSHFGNSRGFGPSASWFKVRLPSILFGTALDSAAGQAQRTEMLDMGVEQDAISPAEAKILDQVHSALADLVAPGAPQRLSGMGQMRDELLGSLVEAGTISQEEASAFNEIHDRLEEAGLME